MQSIVHPAIALMLVTLVVWVVMFIQRVSAVKANNVDMEQMVSPDKVTELLPDSAHKASNNFRNLFELPIIFYALVALLMLTQHVDALFVNLAWVFVALRALHSLVHCSYNKVAHRFLMYLLSSIVLWVMVVRFALMVF